MNEQIIATRIKELRNSLNLTQNEFGSLINVAQTTLSSYEKGTKTPNIETLYNISKKCEISLDWLCGLSNIQKTNNFTSYSDIFRLLVNICKSININITTQETINNFENIYMEPINKKLIDFLDKWLKIKDIYDDKTIDNETYEMVINSIIEKYKDDIIDYNDYPEAEEFQF